MTIRVWAALLAAGVTAAAVSASSPVEAAPPPVRVLLERTAGPIELPQPGRPYQVNAKGASRRISGPLTISLSRSSQLWQVGAWRDSGTAEQAAERLAAALADRAEVIREPTQGELVRVRVAWRAAPPADAAAVLERLGFPNALPVAAGGTVRLTWADSPAVELDGEVELQPLGSWPTAVGSHRYRGLLRVRISGRRLLLINVLDVESYLRGVVPVEMSPAVFPESEALKAQAVAARTYAVAHLGDHDDEGYDLCDSAACQVYHGSDVEHPLTDRAVRETAGMVAVYQGKPIDAMYTSTCGGHTETATHVFPDREQPYLLGVPCAWERPLELLGTQPDGPWRQRCDELGELARRALALPAGAGPSAVLTAVAGRCGGVAVSAESPDAERFATALLQAGGLGPAVGGPALFGEQPHLHRLLQLCDLYGAELSPAVSALGDGWHLRAALAVLQVQGVVVRDSGEAVPRHEGIGIYPAGARRSELLPSPLPLLEAWHGSLRRVARLQVLPGTLLERWRMGERMLGLVVIRSGGDGEADRRSAWRGWVREHPFAEVARRLGMPDLQELRITRRSPTGRVLILAGAEPSGRRREWTGWAARRALDLPETLFSLHRLQRSGGAQVVRFLGRGWGHGIGLCQNGSFGLARSGRTYDEILTTYYTGISVVPWQSLAP